MSALTKRERFALAFGAFALALAGFSAIHSQQIARKATSAANCLDAKGDTVLGCITQVIRYGAVVDNAGNITISHVTGNMDLGTHEVLNGADPTTAQSLGTRAYIDRGVFPIDFSSTAAFPAYTYANGSSGVGATITFNSNVACTNVDGIGVPQVGNHVLFQHGAATSDSGVYVYTQLGNGSSTPCILTRSTRADTAAKLAALKVRVLTGLQNQGAEYIFPSLTTPTIGTDPIFALRIGGNGTNQYQLVTIDDDCLSVVLTSGTYSSPGVFFSATGTAAAGAVTADNGANGVIGSYKFSSGTTNSGRAGLGSSWGISFTSAAEGFSFVPSASVGFTIFERVETTTLSTVTDEYALQFGLSSSMAQSVVTPPNAIEFQYDRPTSTALQLITCSASTCTKTVGPTFNANQWYNLVIKKDFGSNTVHGYVDGTEVGTGQSTNVPTATPLGMLAMGFKSGGIGNIDMFHIDRLKVVLSQPAGRGS